MKASVSKFAVVVALATFTTALSGYFMGLVQADRAAEQRLRPAEESPVADVSTAITAPRYADLANREHQPNHGWSNSLTSLSPAVDFTADTPPLARGAIEALLIKRASRRAYNGAPPTVPHPIDQRGSQSCLACHGQPTRIGDVDVPRMSHALYSQCIQCHAPKNGPGSALASPPAEAAHPVLANSFSGLQPTGGTRAYLGAPPVMPHTTAMRQNCLACHGPGGSSVIKTTHPQRQNCLQCHATDALRETLPPTP